MTGIIHIGCRYFWANNDARGVKTIMFMLSKSIIAKSCTKTKLQKRQKPRYADHPRMKFTQAAEKAQRR